MGLLELYACAQDYIADRAIPGSVVTRFALGYHKKSAPRRPDGEIGRRSGLKIVRVYALTSSIYKINKHLSEIGNTLKADATLTHFPWYS
jgi:hypothetical protein